jgi:hypothetical protein
MQPVGAVSFANAGYASFPGAASGIAPSLLSPYFETMDFTLAMAVQSSGVFTGSNTLNYANTLGGDATQSSAIVGSVIRLNPNLGASSAWSVSGTSANQFVPTIAGDAAV